MKHTPKGSSTHSTTRGSGWLSKLLPTLGSNSRAEPLAKPLFLYYDGVKTWSYHRVILSSPFLLPLLYQQTLLGGLGRVVFQTHPTVPWASLFVPCHHTDPSLSSFPPPWPSKEREWVRTFNSLSLPIRSVSVSLGNSEVATDQLMLNSLCLCLCLCLCLSLSSSSSLRGYEISNLETYFIFRFFLVFQFSVWGNVFRNAIFLGQCCGPSRGRPRLDED